MLTSLRYRGRWLSAVSSRKGGKSLHFQHRPRDIGSGFPALPADLTIYRNLPAHPRTELTKPIRFPVSSRTCLRRHCTDDPFDMLWYGTESLDRLAELGDYRICLDLRASRKNNVFSASDIRTLKQRRLGIHLSCLWTACLAKDSVNRKVVVSGLRSIQLCFWILRQVLVSATAALL
jgi:hypothetical protein